MSDDITFNDLMTKDFSEVLNDGNCWGFFDWFCKDSSLKGKAKNLWGKAKSISRSKRFDAAKCYIFFKNNCPCCGGLYDDFRVCDVETGDVLYTVVPSKTTSNGKRWAEVWGEDNDFEKPLVRGTWKDVRAWFLNK